MNKYEVREKFKALVGDEKYIKFLEALHGANLSQKRLYFWQEKMWETFAEENKLPKDDYEKIREMFLYCYIHNEELKRDTVPIIYGTHAPIPQKEYIEMKTEYPFAAESVSGPCWVEDQKEKEIYYCPECRKVRNEKFKV